MGLGKILAGAAAAKVAKNNSTYERHKMLSSTASGDVVEFYEAELRRVHNQPGWYAEFRDEFNPELGIKVIHIFFGPHGQSGKHDHIIIDAEKGDTVYYRFFDGERLV